MCTGSLLPFARAGSSLPFVGAGPRHCSRVLGPRRRLRIGVGPLSIRRPSCSSVVCGLLAGCLWVLVVVAFFALPLSIALVGMGC